MSMPGGPTEVKDADENVQTLITKLKEIAEDKTGKKYTEFKAVSYMTQVVAGINYFVKVAVDNDEYIFLRIFCALPHLNQAPELVEVQTGKSKDDTLAYF